MTAADGPPAAVSQAPSGTLVPVTGGSFSSGIGVRLVLGVSFVLAAILLSLLIEQVPLPGAPAPTASATQPGAPAASGLLRLQSTFTVKRWTLSIDGRPLDAGRCDATSWQGACAPGQTLLVQATPMDEGDVQLHALQVHLTTGETTRDLALWGTGAVVGTIPLGTP